MAQIEFKQVSKSFGSVKVIEDLNLTIEDGKFTVLVGASGCGKTTLLRMIAGIGPASGGQVMMDGQDITDLAPGKRDIAMVFQNYAIYPTMTVRQNIEFGLKNNHVPKEERLKLIADVASSVGMTEYLDRKPNELSGGQRQRIALARAMVKKPKVFLMDEPLSNLDAKLRVSMRVELIEMHKKLQTTFVYVTHDQVEAMSMADTIVLMNKGKIMQQGTPEEIYHNPSNVFTAQFIGNPPMNILKQGNAQIGIRPERLYLSDKPEGRFFQRRATIAVREMLGSETLYKLNLDDGTVLQAKSLECKFNMDEQVYVSTDRESIYLFDANGERMRPETHPEFEKTLYAFGGMNND